MEPTCPTFLLDVGFLHMPYPLPLSLRPPAYIHNPDTNTVLTQRDALTKLILRARGRSSDFSENLLECACRYEALLETTERRLTEKADRTMLHDLTSHFYWKLHGGYANALPARGAVDPPALLSYTPSLYLYERVLAKFLILIACARELPHKYRDDPDRTKYIFRKAKDHLAWLVESVGPSHNAKLPLFFRAESFLFLQCLFGATQNRYIITILNDSGLCKSLLAHGMVKYLKTIDDIAPAGFLVSYKKGAANIRIRIQAYTYYLEAERHRDKDYEAYISAIAVLNSYVIANGGFRYMGGVTFGREMTDYVTRQRIACQQLSNQLNIAEPMLGAHVYLNGKGDEMGLTQPFLVAPHITPSPAPVN
jgi:hypothetical protein